MNKENKFPIPKHLSHTPILGVENYEAIDGNYSGKSDAKGLSLGIAQWNTAGKTELSAKVWRHSDKRWSRQSEELPLHRVIDLATLICTAIQTVLNKDQAKTKLDGDYVVSAIKYEGSGEDQRLVEVLENELRKNNLLLTDCINRLTDAIDKVKELRPAD